MQSDGVVWEKKPMLDYNGEKLKLNEKEWSFSVKLFCDDTEQFGENE